MSKENPIRLRRDCFAVMIPSGERIALSAGATVWLTQALGQLYRHDGARIQCTH